MPTKAKECVPVNETEATIGRLGEFLAGQGLAIDVACGWRRNSMFLACRGLRVSGVDRSWQSHVAGKDFPSRAKLAVDSVGVDHAFISPPVNSPCFVVCFDFCNPGLYSTLRSSLQSLCSMTKIPVGTGPGWAILAGFSLMYARLWYSPFCFVTRV